eukprot:CAMPEP_0180093246 /NCGR_PEP_ID=MMETSP0985-20121206/24963_1 /TAXON_ID=483367 /ORGANISM="non described non described, Strain CCMP 2436" /LENGTH=156 /DNA_ID=CAMNT_0022028303 /DNA_START=119 /DNA_END=586 /DNA_ORIENTATION=+
MNNTGEALRPLVIVQTRATVTHIRRSYVRLQNRTALLAVVAGLLVVVVEREGADQLGDALDARRILVDTKAEPRRLELVALGATLWVACHADDHAPEPTLAQSARRLRPYEDGHLIVHHDERVLAFLIDDEAHRLSAVHRHVERHPELFQHAQLKR